MKNPKITIEVIDNRWVVTNGKETKIFILWHQLITYLKDNISTGGN